MKFCAGHKENRRSKFVFLSIFFLILFACATVPTKTYDETVSEWQSYKDVAKWMSWHFSYDMTRFRETEGKGPFYVEPRAPEQTFKLKSGVCYDAAIFAKETLNRIDPSYEACIVFLQIRPYGVNHYVCSFRKDGKLYIIDYGTPNRNVLGVHGPYNSLEEYKNFYERRNSKVTRVVSIHYVDLNFYKTK
jgi:hypothetical protein